MQKKLIALAIAGLSSAAFAQSNVTIYGVADATYDNVSATGASGINTTGLNFQSRSRTTMNSSYIGFKGVESLGNGLAVAFQVEQGFGENAGGTNVNAVSTYGLATRDTYVGLAGGFGTIAAGTLTGPARALAASMDINTGATGIGANTALLAKLGGGSGASWVDTRFANAIAYISPNLNGFSGVLAYVPNENRSTDVNTAVTRAADTSAWTLGLNYNNGPILAGYAYTKLKDKNANPLVAGSGYALTVATNPTIAGVINSTLFLQDAENNRLAGKYDFGNGLTVGLMWDKSKATVVGAGAQVNALVAAANAALGTTGTVEQTVWYLPVTYTFGANKIGFQYGKARNATWGGSLQGAGVNSDTSAKHIVLGYSYNLSKRTELKAVWSQITNSQNANFDFLYGVSAPNTTALGGGVAAGADPRGLSLGMRHSF